MKQESEQHLEEILLSRIAGGDQEAFSQLYDLHSGILYALTLRILHEPKDAQDVLQEAFLLIWDKASSYDPTLGKPLSWLITLTRNKALDRVRSLQRRQQLLTAIQLQDEPKAKEEITHRETASLVQTALKELPMDQRQAIELAFYKGMTQLEIAEILKIPLGTAKARIRRGLLKLREALADYV